MADVMMPQLGETVTEGTVTKWMKAVGDTVARDEPLFEVSTDKVDSEVPSPAAGVLTEIIVPEGDTVEVGVVLAVIGDEAGAASPAAAAGAAPPAAEPAPAPPARRLHHRHLRHRHLRHRHRRTATAASIGTPEPGPTRHCSAGLVTGGTDGRAEALVLSPVVRKLLSENGIGPSEITGTGVGGRITREDVLKVADARAALRQHQPPPAAPTTAPTPEPAAAPSSVPVPRGAGRPGRAVLEYAAADGRAHGPIQGHLAARLHCL